MAYSNRTEYAVLGLLALGARSGYDIKRMADDALGHFWNESFGHIYPILKRLEDRDWVTKTTEPQQGRPDRNVYALTPEGERAFAEWFALPVEAPPPRNEVLLKLFFAPLAPRTDVIAQIEAYGAQQQEALDTLDALAERARDEERHNPGLPFWLLTMDHSRAMMKAAVAWSARAADHLRALPDDST